MTDARRGEPELGEPDLDSMTDDQGRLKVRLQHRQLLAELGTAALRLREIDPLLDATCRIVSAGMETRFCKVLEYIPARSKLIVRAGIGWRDGVVGHAELDADLGSPAGHALKTGQPVISNDLMSEDRFRVPSLLAEHGIRRAMNVIIRGDGNVFGVLEADSRRPGWFEAEDTVFMQAAADLIGLAIERKRRETDLEEALRSRELLLREADHRIKNGLQLVTSLLSLQRSRATSPEAVAALEGAMSRVGAVAEAHRALHQSGDLKTIAFGRMLDDLCRHAGELRPSVQIRSASDGELEIDAERAIPLGLIVNELLTNALRHAYPTGDDGIVEARAAIVDGVLEVAIADGGVGIAAAPERAGGLGSTIVTALARQAGVAIERQSGPDKGTTVTLRLTLRGGARHC